MVRRSWCLRPQACLCSSAPSLRVSAAPVAVAAGRVHLTPWPGRVGVAPRARFVAIAAAEKPAEGRGWDARHAGGGGGGGGWRGDAHRPGVYNARRSHRGPSAPPQSTAKHLLTQHGIQGSDGGSGRGRPAGRGERGRGALGRRRALRPGAAGQLLHRARHQPRPRRPRRRPRHRRRPRRRRLRRLPGCVPRGLPRRRLPRLNGPAPRHASHASPDCAGCESVAAATLPVARTLKLLAVSGNTLTTGAQQA